MRHETILPRNYIWINCDIPTGGSDPCPSTADSSAVSLSQMAFLSMAVSIFSTVANIANNLNNNNNNQNDNNLNFVHQQNNNLNMNQNIINQVAWLPNGSPHLMYLSIQCIPCILDLLQTIETHNQPPSHLTQPPPSLTCL